MKKKTLLFTAFILSAIALLPLISGDATPIFLLFWGILAAGFWGAYFVKKD